MTNSKPTLVILAAGMGSRFGGLKQLDTFTVHGETILDFSLFDAIKVGFGKVVFVIRKSFENEFKANFNEKLKNKIEVVYVFQELNSIPKKYQNTQRVKPYGTGHALLVVKDFVKENFAVINADDFYGRDAFMVMAEKLKNTNPKSLDFSMIGYTLKNTISKNGSVSRAECFVNKNNNLIRITERKKIEFNNGILKSENNYNQLIPIDQQTIVSMNFWGFTPSCFDELEKEFLQFLKRNFLQLNAEFYIPDFINNLLNEKKATVKLLTSPSKWFGFTYREDKSIAEAEVKKLKKDNIYPNNLWS